MSNLHRIQWIDTQIRADRFPNCSLIAEEFCISRRQASRDIEYLRDSLCAPVEYSPVRYGYYYSDNTFVLPGLMVTESEKQALNYLAGQFRDSKSSLASSLAHLFARLSGEQSNDNNATGYDIPLILVREKEIVPYNVLKKAVYEQKKVEMVYVNSGNIKTRRVFCPYRIFRKNNNSYVVGYCEFRNEIRIFRLNRIREIGIQEQKFQILPRFDATKYGEDLRFDYREPYQAVISFDRKIASGKLDMDPVPAANGACIIRFTSSCRLISSLMGLDVGFKIHHPDWLRIRLVEQMQKIIQKNLP